MQVSSATARLKCRSPPSFLRLASPSFVANPSPGEDGSYFYVSRQASRRVRIPRGKSGITTCCNIMGHPEGKGQETVNLPQFAASCLRQGSIAFQSIEVAREAEKSGWKARMASLLRPAAKRRRGRAGNCGAVRTYWFLNWSWERI